MSYQAVQWALDDAPMLLTPAGKPDTTARAVLVARAERADDNGRDTYAAITEIIWRTGYDERTVQRAQERLEAAGLMVRDGTTRWGTPRWNLDMNLKRDQSDRDKIDVAIERRRAENAERERARRARVRVDSESTRVDGNSTRVDSASERVDAAPPEPPMNHPGTTPEPPTGGTLPPDPLGHESPSGPRTENPDSLSERQDQHQDAVSNHRPHARENTPERSTGQPSESNPQDTEPMREPCPHGRSRRRRRDGTPRCPECRTPAADDQTTAVVIQLRPTKCPHGLPNRLNAQGQPNCQFCRRETQENAQ